LTGLARLVALAVRAHHPISCGLFGFLHGHRGAVVQGLQVGTVVAVLRHAGAEEDA
jgi:hypothetical protein